MQIKPSILRTGLMLLVLWFSLAAPVATAGIYVIDLKHRSARDIIPVIKPLMPPGSTISGMNNQLIIRSSNTGYQRILAIVNKLDRTLVSLRISVKQVLVRTDRETNQSISYNKTGGRRSRITVSGGSKAVPGDRNGGASITQRDRKGDINYRTKQSRTNTADETLQVIRVIEGNRAYIRLGVAVPVIIQTNRGGVVIRNSRGLQMQTTGLQILPRLQGDRVILEIMPHFADPGHRHQRPAGVAMRTTVVARLGEWLDIGSIAGMRRHKQRGLHQSSASFHQAQRTILIKVEKIP